MTQQIAYSVSQLHDKANPVAPWSRSQTYKFIADGDLTPRYVGSKPVILHDDLERLINRLPKGAAQ